MGVYQHAYCPPPPPATPTLLQYYCTPIAQYTPRHQPSLVTPYTIQYWRWQYRAKAKWESGRRATGTPEGTPTGYGIPLGLYTILPLPILCGMYCNKGWSGGNTVLRNGVGDEGRGWGAQTKQVFANNNIDSCIMASS